MQTPLTREVQQWLGDPLDRIVAIPFRSLHGRPLLAVSSLLMREEEGEARAKDEERVKVRVRSETSHHDGFPRRRLASHPTPHATVGRAEREERKQVKGRKGSSGTGRVDSQTSSMVEQGDQRGVRSASKEKEVEGGRERERVTQVSPVLKPGGEERETDKAGKEEETRDKLYKHLRVKETSYLKHIVTDPHLMRNKKDEFTIMMREKSRRDALEVLEVTLQTLSSPSENFLAS